MVLDKSVPPNMADIDALVHSCSNVLHQSSQNALPVLLPQKYSGQGVHSNLNLSYVRRVEDALLGCGVNIECEIGLYFVDQLHGNDKRPLSARCRLCVSDQLPESSSPWLSSMAASGKLSEVPFMCIKEMKRLTPPNHVGDTVGAYNLSPAERCQQKGVKAASKILESLVGGTPLASPDARVDIVEFNLLGFEVFVGV